MAPRVSKTLSPLVEAAQWLAESDAQLSIWEGAKVSDFPAGLVTREIEAWRCEVEESVAEIITTTRSLFPETGGEQ